MPYSEAIYANVLERARTDLARDDVGSLRETFRQAKNLGNDFLDRLVGEIHFLVKSRVVATKISTKQVNDIAGHF